MANPNDSFMTYRKFVDSGAVGLNAGITFNPPPKALYVEQGAGSTDRAIGVQYRNRDGELLQIGAIDGAGVATAIHEIGDCVQVTKICNRNQPNNGASANSKVYGLY